MADGILSLRNRKIVLGVSGSIAAYKSLELLRLLVAEGAKVYVVMSANATKFITPLTFEVLSGNPVYHQVFESNVSATMEHIRAAESADLLLVAPATAGTIGKLANGIADDALSNLFIAFRGAVIVAPAMNDGMLANQAVQTNIETMKQRGVGFVEPEHGELACGTVGQGRLAEPCNILQAVKQRLHSQNDLSGIRVLVTAGPTHEALDPVRYITNPSSGKMGYAIACAARDRGAIVSLVSGPTHLSVPEGVHFLRCKKAVEMNELVSQQFPGCDILIMTAAVGDFAPAQIEKEKIKKKGGAPLILQLKQTEDILSNVTTRRTKQFVVGFAAESENLTSSALEKLRKKNLDLIVANDISAPGIGFQSDSNQVTLINKKEEVEHLPLLPKTEIAHLLLNRILASIQPLVVPSPSD